ncbi:MAG: hypothetical protein QXI89_01910 [Candidatus Anstonellales archaeon]
MLGMLRKGIAVFLCLAVFSYLLFAQVTGEEAGERIKSALCALVDLLKSVLAPLIILAIVLAAVIYGAGHVLGQEFGARAKSWALNIVIFAAIGIIIYVITPFIFKQLVPEINIETAC